MFEAIAEFWIRYRIISLENKIRRLDKIRQRVKKRGDKLTVKYEHYRAKQA